ncbi:hypothetical protein D3C80_1597940 [compost metagenome]
MLCTTNIQVYRQPFLLFFIGAQLLIIVWINITQIVPAASRPLRHCIRFTTCWKSGFRIGRVYPISYVSKWRFTRTRWFDMINFRQQKWKLILRNWLHGAIFQMQNRNWLAPVALTAEQPVAQAVSDFALAFPVFFKPGNHFLDRFFIAKAIQKP